MNLKAKDYEMNSIYSVSYSRNLEFKVFLNIDRNRLTGRVRIY